MKIKPFQLTSDPFQTKINLLASSSSSAGLNIPVGSAPSSPVIGDIYSVLNALYYYNGATKTIAFTDSSITGSAATLTIPRTISASGDVAWSVSFDGSGNVSGSAALATVNSNLGTFGSSAAVPVLTLDGKGRVTAATTAPLGTAALKNTGTSGNTIPLLDGTNTWTNAQMFGGTIVASNFSGSSTGTNTGDQTAITGNAGTATALQTPRTISITGDLFYTTTFDGTGNVTGVGSLTTVNSNVGTFGSAAAVPILNVNAKGLVTGISTAALGTAATYPIGTAGASVPLLNGANTWSGTQTFSNNVSFINNVAINIAAGGAYTIKNDTGTTRFGSWSGSSSGSFLDSTSSLTLRSSDGTVTWATLQASGFVVNGAISASNFSGTTSGSNTGDQTITLTGDVTGSGTGSFAATLATVNTNTGSFGSSAAVPVLTVNGKGLITAVSTAALGTAASVNTGTSGATIPLLNTANTWNAAQTFGARVSTPASTTSTAGLNLPHGTAPSSPINGDIWTTTSGAYAQVNGSTVPLSGGSTNANFPFFEGIVNAGSNGSGGLSLNANSFAVAPINTVATDTHNGWNSTNYAYTVPQTGLYDILFKFRINDQQLRDQSYGIGVDTTIGDSANFSWYLGTPSRQGASYRRIYRFNAGDVLKPIYYLDSFNATLINADLVIMRIF